jgi:hypothetical protein
MTKKLLPSLLLLAAALCGCRDEAGPELTAGPWLLRLDADQIVVAWETDDLAPGRLEVWTPDRFHRAEHAHRTRVHRLRIGGLRPETRYHYRVLSRGSKSPILSFRTPAAELQSLTFAVYGRVADDRERHAEFATAIRRADPAFVVYTGGYTAPRSEGPADAAALRQRFLSPASDLFARHPVVPVPASGEGRWLAQRFPEGLVPGCRSYRLGSVEVFLLDVWRRAEGGAREIGMVEGGERYQWLHDALRRSPAWWKFVVLDPPLLGSEPKERHDRLCRVLLPLLLQHEVDAVFTGGSSRTRSVPLGVGQSTESQPLVCFTTTAGRAAEPDPAPWLAGGSGDPHFLLVEATPERATVTARDADGHVFDSAVLTKLAALEEAEEPLPAEAIEAFLAFTPREGFVLKPSSGDPSERTVRVRVANPYHTPIQATLRWNPPSGSGWTLAPPVLEVAVPARRTEVYEVAVTVQSDAGPPPTFELTVRGRTLTCPRSPFRLRRENGG